MVVEDLHSGAQQHWLGHPREISTLALSHDAQVRPPHPGLHALLWSPPLPRARVAQVAWGRALPADRPPPPRQVLASASSRISADSHCQIRLWDVPGGSCRQLLFHHDTAVQALAFSPDDRLLVTLGQRGRGRAVAPRTSCLSRAPRWLKGLWASPPGDCRDHTLALWSLATHELLSSVPLPEPVHGVAFNPWDASKLTCVGRGAVTSWLLQQRGGSVSLQVPGCRGGSGGWGLAGL